MITADQIVVHLAGDYLTQSDWMASFKTKSSFAALCHAAVYSVPFWLFHPTVSAWLVIFGTHYLIDRYRLARYVVWAKNFLAPPGSNPPWSKCKDTFGYPPDRPAWLAMWLMVIGDNICHILLNGIALRYL
jgi:hypothetical protein